MQPQDRAAVVAILSGSEPWTTLGFTPGDWNRIFAPLPQGRECYVLENEAQILGIAIVRPRFLFGDYLELLGIAAAWKGKGFGTRLLAHLEHVAFGRGKNLFACVTDFNKDARSFYAKQGFVEIGRLENLLIDGSAEILLRKTIGPARSHRPV
jgi:ribosomal protein S18 acetylase RimI-like enzyme